MGEKYMIRCLIAALIFLAFAAVFGIWMENGREPTAGAVFVCAQPCGAFYAIG